MFYKRLREIDVPEMMASIITETKGKPWGYYRDMTRQLWDEARHAMMGEVGFVSPRHRLAAKCHDELHLVARAEHAAHAERTPRRALFHRAGADAEDRQTLRVGNGAGGAPRLSALFQDYDWADEVLHARVGRDWYVSQFENPKEAVEWGDKRGRKCSSAGGNGATKDSRSTATGGPTCMRAIVRRTGRTPVPHVLAFAETYEQKRADLKVLPASA